MLLSVANAMYTGSTSDFRMVDTSSPMIPHAAPLSFDISYPDGMTVMATDLAMDTMCHLTNRMVKAGTEVWAPVYSLYYEVKGAPSDAFVYPAHDVTVLRDNAQAFFYEPEILQRILNDKRMYGAEHLVFDPMTFGTGDVARYHHPLMNLDPAFVQHRFDVSRGPFLHVKERMLIRHHETVSIERGGISAGRRGMRVVLFSVIQSPYEVQCMRYRLRGVMDGLPRAPDKRMTPGMSDIDATLLPRGAQHMQCCEGQVVQSPTAWTLRLDGRIRRIFQDLDARRSQVPLDLPLICYTGDSLQHLDQPWLARAALDEATSDWIGILALGPDELGLWTVFDGHPPHDNLFDDQGVCRHVPSRVEWSHNYPQSATIENYADFLAKISTVRGQNVAVTLFFDDVKGNMRLRYTSCPPGHIALWNARTSPWIVNLPPITPPRARTMSLGLMLAYAERPPSGMAERVKRGQCPVAGPAGQPTGVVSAGAEQARLAGLLPRAAPYDQEPGNSRFQRDAGTQNLQYAVPHVYTALSQSVRRIGAEQSD